MGIIKGEEYQVPILLMLDDEPLTDEMVSQVRIALDTAVCTYPNGKLTYNEGLWFFPLTQELSYKLKGDKIPFQAQIKTGSMILSTEIQMEDLSDTIFKGVWE